MKILVDHGSRHNLGDTAMIEGAVRLLLDRLPGAEAHVVRRPDMRTELWAWDRVRPAPQFSVAWPRLKLADLGFFNRSPLYRARGLRWLAYRVFNPEAPHPRLERPWVDRCFASLGVGLRSGEVRVRDERGERSLRDWVEPYDAYFVVGGGNLTETFVGELWPRLLLVHAFAERGRPVVFGGQQVGPFWSRPPAEAAGRALALADFVGLREPTDSVDFCRRSGLDPRRFGVIGDDSFGVEEAPTDEALAWTGLGLEPGRFLAVNVRIAAYGGSGEGHLDEVAALVGGLRDRLGMPAVVVPIALNPGDSDVDSGRRLAARLGGAGLPVVDRPGLTPSLAKGILGGAYGAVGVSYHFCTFALGHGVPTACIYHGDYYAQKARGLATFWGDDRIALELGRGDPSRSLAQVAAILEDGPARAALAARAPGLASSWRDGLGAVLERSFAAGARSPAPVA